MLRLLPVTSALLWACSAGPHPSGAGTSDAQDGARAGSPAGGAGAESDAGSSAASRTVSSMVGAGGFAFAGEPTQARFSAGAAGVAGIATGGTASAGAPAAAGAGGSSSEAGGSSGAGADPARVCALALAAGGTPTSQSSLIGSYYRQIVALDCRYAGLNCGFDFPAKGSFASALAYYGPSLWHCDGAVPHQFLLTYPTRKLTRADAEALIELYVNVTMKQLQLSDKDGAGLRNELRTLMLASIAEDAISISLCDSGGVCPVSEATGGSGSGGSGGGDPGGGDPGGGDGLGGGGSGGGGSGGATHQGGAD